MRILLLGILGLLGLVRVIHEVSLAIGCILGRLGVDIFLTTIGIDWLREGGWRRRIGATVWLGKGMLVVPKIQVQVIVVSCHRD